MDRDQYISKKGKPVCTCKAYDFPHRLDCKGCRELYNSQSVEDEDRELLRDFDREEARAINRSNLGLS